jgi:hypothetical protein
MVYNCLTKRANLRFLFGESSACGVVAAMQGRCIYNSKCIIMPFAHFKMFIGRSQMFFGHPKMFFGHPKMFFGHPKVFFGHPKVFFGRPKMFLGHPKVLFGHPEMFFGHPKVFFEFLLMNIKLFNLNILNYAQK